MSDLAKLFRITMNAVGYMLFMGIGLGGIIVGVFVLWFLGYAVSMLTLLMIREFIPIDSDTISTAAGVMSVLLLLGFAANYFE